MRRTRWRARTRARTGLVNLAELRVHLEPMAAAAKASYERWTAELTRKTKSYGKVPSKQTNKAGCLQQTNKRGRCFGQCAPPVLCACGSSVACHTVVAGHDR